MSCFENGRDTPKIRKARIIGSYIDNARQINELFESYYQARQYVKSYTIPLKMNDEISSY